MRSERHTIACVHCIAAITIEIRDHAVLPGIAELLTRLATHLKWDATERRCPMHR